jgi:LacI family transcriptional regulator
MDTAPAAERVQGWADALRNCGLLPRKQMIWHAPFGRQDGYHVARRMLADRDVDAVFVTSDEQALGVLRALRDLRLRCPDDVAIASFDGITSGAFSTPALTTMAQPFADLGQQSLNVLLARIENHERPVSRTVLPVTLIRRGSCGCPDEIRAEPE